MTDVTDPGRIAPADVLVPESDALLRRVPPLEGGINFRDMGGYATQDGRRVRWGRLYRSGSLSGLTQADYGTLAGLGIRRVVDLRTPEERAAEPNRWAAAAGISSWSRDYQSTFGVLRELLASGLPTPEAAREALKAGYRRLPFEHAPAYRVLFESLRDGALPMVFNCSAGKDRAGTAAALILAALGVPRATVLEDYALTDRTLDISRLRSFRSTASQGGETVLTRVPPEVLAVVMGTHPDYLACAFDAIEAQHGTFEAYLDDALDITGDTLHRIRDAVLE